MYKDPRMSELITDYNTKSSNNLPQYQLHHQMGIPQFGDIVNHPEIVT